MRWEWRDTLTAALRSDTIFNMPTKVEPLR